MELHMVLLYIVAFIALATIIGVMVWFALQERTLDGNNNGFTAAQQDVDTHWPFPHHRP
jgi:uncharacterized membrane protein YraQ (UPF0718 family)